MAPDTAFIDVTVYAPIEIEEPDPPLTFCQDEPVDINLLDYICGGDGSYTISWSDNRGNSGSSNLISQNYASGMITYDIDVTDDHNCMGSGQISVEVQNELMLSITGEDEVCSYDAPVVLSGVASGGTGVFDSYVWTLPNSSTVNSFPDTFINATETGLYLLEVTDDAGCTIDAMFDLIIHDPPAYTSLMVPADGEICEFGPNAVMQVAPFVNNLNITWEVPLGFSQNINGLFSFDTDVEGTYVFTLTDITGCISRDSFEVILLPTPTGVTDTLEACDDGSGEAIFDLTMAESNVNNSPDVTFSWFEDSGLTTAILNPTAFSSGPTVVYVVVTDMNTDCPSVPIPVVLSFRSTLTANDATQERCLEIGGFGSFDLQDLIDDISGGLGTVEYYYDTAFTDPITTTDDFETADTVIYAYIRDMDGCISNRALITLTTDTLLEAFPSTLSACLRLDGTSIYDLTTIDDDVTNGQALTVVWYEDEDRMNPIGDPTNYITSSTFVYATVTDGVCASNLAIIVLGQFDSGPTSRDSLEACDEGGVGTFDLVANGNVIVSGGATGTVHWFEDAMGTTTVVDPTSYTTGNDSVYAIFEDMDGCISQITGLPLIIGPIVARIPDPLSECDPGTGQATFDLTIRDGQVSNNVAGRVVEWFEDNMAMSPIGNPTSYVSSGGIIYVRVREGSCVSDLVPMELFVTVDLPANPASLEACIQASGLGTFDLSDANTTVNSNTSLTIRYYADTSDLGDSLMNITNYVSGPVTIYAVVFDGDCRSFAQPVTLTTAIQVFPPDDLSYTECDEGGDQSTFDLTSYDFDLSGNAISTVTWYEDASATILISGPMSFISGPTTVYAVVTTDEGCISDPVSVVLDVEIVLTAEPVDISTCDEGGGMGTFDLTEYELAIQGNIASRTVTWYTDTLAAPIPNPSNFMANNGDVIFAVVSDGRCVSAAMAYVLSVVNNLPANPASLATCDDGGQGVFNLNTIIDDIIGSNSFTVAFFLNSDLTGPITGDLSSYVSGPTTIYAITIDGNCQSLPVEVDLTLIPAIVPEPTSDETCDDGTGMGVFDLTQLESTIDNGQGFEVQWYVDSDTTNRILNVNNYNTSTGSVWAVLTNGSCRSVAVEIALNVITLTGSTAEGFACDEGAGTGTFNLRSLEGTVTSDPGLVVLWYQDMGLTLSIDPDVPYVSADATIYVALTDGECTSQPISITLTLTDALPADNAELVICDDGDGMIDFDLTTLIDSVNTHGSGVVRWYLDNAGSNEIINPGQFPSASNTIYAQVEDGVCRSAFVEVNLVVNPLPSLMVTEDQQLDCSTPLLSLVVTVGGNVNVIWTTSNGQILTDPTLNSIDIDRPGTYRVTVSNQLTSCMSIAEVIVTEDDHVPDADAGLDQVLTCNEASQQLGGSGTSSGPDIVYEWYLDGAPLATNATTLMATDTGTYVLEVTDLNSACVEYDTVEVNSIIVELSNPMIEVIQPNCTGPNTGCIRFLSTDGGGQPPYTLLLDDGTMSIDEICGLGEGRYGLTIVDQNGCSVETEFEMQPPAILEAEIIADRIIEYGDTARVAGTHSPETFIITDYDWSSDFVVGTITDSLILLHGLVDMPVTLTITDENGCTAVASALIFVSKNFTIYAPNAFSPFREDGVNDRFTLFGDVREVTMINELSIYSRWGEKLFQNNNIAVNDLSAGWNGTFRGERMLPGAYVFHATVTYVDGSTEFLEGSFDLID